MADINTKNHKAQKLYDKGDYEGASAGFLQLCQHYETEDPTSIELLSILTNLYSCFLSLRKYDEAKNVGFKYIEFGERTKMKTYIKVGYSLVKSVGAITNDADLVSKYENLIEKLEEEEAEKADKANAASNDHMKKYTNIQMTKENALDYAVKMELDPKNYSDIGSGLEVQAGKIKALNLKENGLLDQAVEMAYKTYCAALTKGGKSQEAADCLKLLGDCVGYIILFDNQLTKAAERAEDCYEYAVKMWENNSEIHTAEFVTFQLTISSMLKCIKRNEKALEIANKAENLQKNMEQIRLKNESEKANLINNVDQEHKLLKERITKLEEQQSELRHQYQEISSNLKKSQTIQDAKDKQLKNFYYIFAATFFSCLIGGIVLRHRI